MPNSDVLFCRLSRSFVEVESVFVHLSKKTSHIIVYEHQADADVSRTHLHYYIEGCTVTVEGIKKMIRNICPDISRYDWSFNTKDIDRNCITYMTKGDLQPVFKLSDIDTEYYRGLWEDKPKKQYQSRLQYVVKESASEAKKRKNDLIVEMIAMLGDTNDYTEDNIIKSIIKVLNDNKVIFSRYTIRDYYDTIQSRADPQKFYVQMKKFLEYRL